MGRPYLPHPHPQTLCSPAPEPSYIPAPSYSDDSYHPSGSSTPGYSTAPISGTAPSGGYTVNYNTEPAYYPVPTASTTGTAKKISLNITTRTDSSGNITLEWEKVRKADKYTVYYLSGKRYTRIGSTAKTTYTVTGHRARQHLQIYGALLCGGRHIRSE